MVWKIILLAKTRGSYVNVVNISDLPETPTFIPPFPIPPPQIIMESTNILIQPPSVNNPPSYDESADIEDRRITE